MDTLSDAGLPDFELPIHMGIATGEVFQAIVGEESSKAERLEIGLMGEAYNRAQALLSLAQGDFSKIYIDYLTMSQARSQIDVKYVRHIEQLSKFFNMPVFERLMVEALDEFSSSTAGKENVKQRFKKFEQDFIKQGSLIKIHHNPMVIDYNNSYQMLNNKIYGRA